MNIRAFASLVAGVLIIAVALAFLLPLRALSAECQPVVASWRAYVKGRSLDLSRAAAAQLGIIEAGVATVCAQLSARRR